MDRKPNEMSARPGHADTSLRRPRARCEAEPCEKVSKEAWDLWLQESVRYINTDRVDLSSREGTEFMLKQLRIWLGLEDGELAQTAWVPPKEEA